MSQTLRSRHTMARWLYLGGSAILLALVLVQLYDARQRAIEAAERSVETSMLISEQALLATFTSIEATLADIAMDIKENPRPLKDYPRRRLILHREALMGLATAHFRLVDTKGEIAQASDGLIKLSLADREFFKVLKEGKQGDHFISEPLKGKVTKGWIVVFAHRLVSADGKFAGVAFASIETGLFEKYRALLGLAPTDLFTIATGAKRGIAHRTPSNEDYLGKQLHNVPVTTGIVELRDRPRAIVDFRAQSDNIRRLSGITWVGKYSILVVIGRGFDAILTPWYRECLIFLPFTLLVIILGFVLMNRLLATSAQIADHQAQLASTAKLVALGEMAASIAHEINNPLAIIKGRAELLREKLDSESRFKVTRDLERIEFTIDRISRIISGLRSFSRNAEKDPLELRDVRTIVEETTELCVDRFRANNTRLEFRASPSAFVHCRSAQISQVLLNLLNNSFDATEQQENRWVAIDVACFESAVQISVTDSGGGIPKEIAERMLEPFYSTKPIGKGTGLGLSISMGIIEMHGGALRYDDHATNTRFVISLPIAKGAPIEAAPVAQAAQR